MRGHFPKDEIVISITEWSKKLQPKRFAILGGEPLLHPNFEEIVMLAYKSFKLSEIVIVSNGTLLEKLDDAFLRTVSKLGRIRFDISQHTELLEWCEQFAKNEQRFISYNVPITLRKSYAKWMLEYQQDSDGRYIPYRTFPPKAWDVCSGKSFYKLHLGKLYYCTRLTSVLLAYQEGLFGKEWKFILSHQPMTLENKQDEILAYLKQGAISECSMCSDTIVCVEPRQTISLDSIL
jgi:sulfatase maturation enzyme AslB (radical SAM superfamily)